MKDERCTAVIQFRAPPRLAEALKIEAQRLMISQSSLMRLTLVECLGLGASDIPAEEESPC